MFLRRFRNDQPEHDDEGAAGRALAETMMASKGYAGRRLRRFRRKGFGLPSAAHGRRSRPDPFTDAGSRGGWPRRAVSVPATHRATIHAAHAQAGAGAKRRKRTVAAMATGYRTSHFARRE